MTALSFNPFTWDESSKAIQSSVSSLELQSEEFGSVNVSNLKEDIIMVIPILGDSKNNNNPSKVSEHSFLKPNRMSFRSYHVELADTPLTIKLGVQEFGVVIGMAVKFGSRPTTENFDHDFEIMFNSTCVNHSTERNLTAISCIPETSVQLVPSKTGIVFIGLLYAGAKNSTGHSRSRRSCFGHGRQRRACVGLKDPPPKGVNNTVVPKYDPSTDLNYTMTITQSSCLYWSEVKNKWTGDGCKVTKGT